MIVPHFDTPLPFQKLHEPIQTLSQHSSKTILINRQIILLVPTHSATFSIPLGQGARGEAVGILAPTGFWMGVPQWYLFATNQYKRRKSEIRQGVLLRHEHLIRKLCAKVMPQEAEMMPTYYFLLFPKQEFSSLWKAKMRRIISTGIPQIIQHVFKIKLWVLRDQNFSVLERYHEGSEFCWILGLQKVGRTVEIRTLSGR